MLWIGLAVTALVGLAAWRARVSRSVLAIVVLGTAIRAAVILNPAVKPIDLYYHAHNVAAYQKGWLSRGKFATSSRKDRDLLRIPYPPLLYAALTSVLGDTTGREGVARTASTLRVLMLVLEASAPLFVFAIARRLFRGDGRAFQAEWALAFMAAMPEGTLVLVKGIATNILGQTLTLAALAALAAGAHAALVFAFGLLVFLAHPGAAVTFLTLIASWIAWEALEGRPVPVGRIVVPLAFAALGAWFLYYAKVWGLVIDSVETLNQMREEAPSRFFEVRWVHVGKMLADLVLKFGASLPVLAGLALWRSRRDVARPRLVPAWLAVASGFGVLSVITPFAVRFEYFASPAIALAAAHGLRWVDEQARPRRAAQCAAGALLVQLGIALAAILGRFHPISVIIPSSRWPFPFEP